ncbi:hypothetical protein, partial [Yaniella flava]|uniref:hypothetical protein n=1 Tax=Yaniella flava TaxID=287930 RepID=UPI0031D9490C
MDDAHFPLTTATGPQQRSIMPKSAAEKQFLAIGAGAQAYVAHRKNECSWCLNPPVSSSALV